MVEFNAELYPLSEDSCCYCDEVIADQVPRGKMIPQACGGGGVFVMIHLTFCKSCLSDLAERANDVIEAIDRHEKYTTSEVEVTK